MSLADRIATGNFSSQATGGLKNEYGQKIKSEAEDKPAAGKGLKLSIQELISQDSRGMVKKNENFQRLMPQTKDDPDATKGFSALAAQTIMQQYLQKQNPTPEENEAAYASLV